MQKLQFRFGSALIASIIATIIMTISWAFFGVNIMKMLGMNMGRTGTGAYIAGGILHLAIGIFYGFVYALFFANWLQKKLPGIIAGALYGFVPFIIALFTINSFMSMTSGLLADKERVIDSKRKITDSVKETEVPTHVDYPESRYDYGSKCYRWEGKDSDPYHPSCPGNGYKSHTEEDDTPATQPDELYEKGPKAQNRETPSYLSDRKNNGNVKSNWLISLINHLIYGFVLGLLYRPKRIEMKQE